MREAFRDFVITTGAAVLAVLFAVTGAAAQQSPDGPVKTRMSLDVPMPAEAGADVQVTLTWDVDSDLDLAVVEPSGEYIHYGNQTSRTGGTLDIDSNADCNIDGKRVENIRWPPGKAPEGEYRVEVAQYSSCETSRSNYTVRIVNGASVQTFRGTISGERTIIEVATFSRRVGDPSRPVEQRQAECLNDAGVRRSPANPAWDPVVGPCVGADEAEVLSLENLVEACRVCWSLHGNGTARTRVSSLTTQQLQEIYACITPRLRQVEAGIITIAGVGLVAATVASGTVPVGLGVFVVTLGTARAGGVSPVELLVNGLAWTLGIEPSSSRGSLAGATASVGNYRLKVQSTNPDVLAFDFAANGDLEFHFGRSEPTAFVWTLMEGDTPIGSLVLPYTPRAAPVPPVLSADRAALEELYHATNGPNWRNNTNWLTDAPLGEWHGVETDSTGRVISLILSPNNLSGPIYNNAGLCAPADAAFQAWLATIDDFRGDVCAAPEPVGTIPAQTLRDGGGAIAVNVAGYFEDPNGDPLTYTAASSDPGVVIAAVSGSTVTLTPVSAGAATVTVTARDPAGLSTTQTIAVTVTPAAAATDRAALAALYAATGGPGWANSTNWETSAPLGEWYGVTTDASGRVTELNLINNGLTGSIPPALEELANLEVLHLQRNNLTGPVPAWLGDMTRLRWLRLGGNGLTGRIPDALARLASLEQLYLWGNDLTGPVPAPLGTLRGLTHLQPISISATTG